MHVPLQYSLHLLFTIKEIKLILWQVDLVRVDLVASWFRESWSGGKLISWELIWWQLISWKEAVEQQGNFDPVTADGWSHHCRTRVELARIAKNLQHPLRKCFLTAKILQVKSVCTLRRKPLYLAYNIVQAFPRVNGIGRVLRMKTKTTCQVPNYFYRSELVRGANSSTNLSLSLATSSLLTCTTSTIEPACTMTCVKYLRTAKILRPTLEGLVAFLHGFKNGLRSVLESRNIIVFLGERAPCHSPPY